MFWQLQEMLLFLAVTVGFTLYFALYFAHFPHKFQTVQTFPLLALEEAKTPKALIFEGLQTSTDHPPFSAQRRFNFYQCLPLVKIGQQQDYEMDN